MSLPPLKTLPAFEAVARLNSFSLAAGEMNLTQSAISHQIRALEDSLGEELFVRAGRKLSLTEAGEQFLEAVAPALAQIERAAVRLRGSSDERLRLAVPSSLAVCWLIPRLPQFQRQHPGIEIDLEMLSDMPHMSDRIADCFLTVRYRQRGYQSQRLYVEQLFAICSRPYWQQMQKRLREEKLLADDEPRSLDPGWLLRYRLLSAASLFDRPGEDWRRWFAAAGAELPTDARLHHFSHMLLAHEAARHDQGIALANDYMIDTAADPDLVRLPVPPMATGDEFHLAYKTSRRNEAAIRALAAWLEEQAARSGW
ncbi:LysR family transcriptional regulator [Wenzhouxiangella sp. AB-CW3]|uniref:LysR substrate-binding domain-containing protein n=1 Tax=Wenzhouxiangella sp. AB-CW3 TaxID=2771012 RepID=UPI00168B4AFE|nr:LysR substrate-binding domain-containing protein [Wenzhouxiangella sp. AB-CW3]QOC22593.1 LysR family transcriptional regulator [Wenzhouxiangella sp. AB-CW3]